MTIDISGYVAGRGIIGRQYVFAATGAIETPIATDDDTPIYSVNVQNNSTANVVNVYNSAGTDIVYVIPASGSIVIPIRLMNLLRLSGTAGQRVSLMGILK